ncbi:hypothetical protein [Sporisorium scitamineum]|uniref:Uncharacterized protein n=1 Tax=Sporisorium scitamineum TaxID=49012 RepID=A0A0F7S6E0_9BASI|nr:hypothetical protein [Sporisorium scitamineum]
MSQPGFAPYLKGAFSFFRTLQSFAEQSMFEFQIQFPPEDTCTVQRQANKYLAQRTAETGTAATGKTHPSKSSNHIEKHSAQNVAKPKELSSM